MTIETAFLSAHLAMSIKIEDVKKKKRNQDLALGVQIATVVSHLLALLNRQG